MYHSEHQEREMKKVRYTKEGHNLNLKGQKVYTNKVKEMYDINTSMVEENWRLQALKTVVLTEVSCCTKGGKQEGKETCWCND